MIVEKKYLFTIDKEEMKTKVQALTGFEKERDEIKTLAKKVFVNGIEEFKKYMSFLDMNGNVLLYGKPGTGKTSICYDCMLDYEKATYYQINMSALISEKMGKTAQKIDEIFRELLDETLEDHVYLLIEEIEAFLPNRSKSKDLEDMKRALTIFMHYLDKPNPNLMVLCTTNYIENLDPAIVRRFSYKLEIVNNSIEDMEKFLVNKDNPFNPYFEDKALNRKIAETIIEKGMTFSDVKNVMRKLFLESNKIDNVNSSNFYKMIMEENDR